MEMNEVHKQGSKNRRLSENNFRLNIPLPVAVEVEVWFTKHQFDLVWPESILMGSRKGQGDKESRIDPEPQTTIREVIVSSMRLRINSKKKSGQ